jgi:hypothetical protein
MPTLNELSEALVRADEAGDVAAATELAAAIHSQLQPAAPPKPIEEQSATAGPIEALKGSAKRFVSSTVTGAQLPFGAEEAATAGIARQEGIKERSAGSLEEVKKAYREKGLLPAAKEVISQIPGVIAEQAPLIGTMAAGARLGAVAGPWGAVAGSILATIPSYMGSSAERRAQEQIAKGEPVDINVAGAVGSAAGQASLDRLSLGLGGLGKLFGISAKQLGTEAAEKLAKESLATAIAKGTIKTELAEIPTEIAQQAIERYYAGLSLTDEDALKEYGDIAYQTSLMGPLGGVAGVSQRSEARDTVKKAADLQNQTLARIESERQRINQIALDAQNEAQLRVAAEEATKLAQESLNALGNKAPEKSKIARSIANMQKDFEKAIIENDVNAQKKAIDDLTNVPTSLVSLATPSPVINDATFNKMKIGPTAIIRKNKELHGLNPTILEDNVKIRNTLNALYETKEADSPQAVAIKNYLDSIPQPKELQNETTDVSGSGEGVQISGQSMAGELAGGTEGLDGTGLGSTADNVRQPDGREEGLPAPLKTPKFKPAMGIMAALKKKGGINTEFLFDLTGEKSVNKSGATVGLFTKNGKGLDDAVQDAIDEGYLPSDVLNEVDGGVEKLSDLIIDEIQGKKAVPLDQQADTELEAYLAREEQKQALREEAPPATEEDVNKQLAEAAAEEKGILEAAPAQLAEPTPIYNQVTNADAALKAIVKEANQPQKALINLLRKVPNIGTTRFTTNREVESTGNAPGYYDPNTNHVYVNPKAVDHVQITLHEIYHAATEAALDKNVKEVNGRPVGVTPLGKKAVRLFEAFNQAAAKKKIGFYGQKDIKEFFSEAETNPELKQFLQNQEGILGLKPAKGKIQTLWSDFVNIIKGFFGVPDSAHSMLDEILLLSPQFMTGPEVTATPKEVLEARRPTEGLTRPDGTPLKYVEDNEEGIIQKFKNVFNDDTNYWRKWMDQLGNKIVGGRYSVERKALDADLPAVDAFKEGKIRGDLINLQAYNSMSLAQAGLYLGRLILRKSGLVIAGDSSGPDKVKMLDITKNWNELLDRATTDLGSKELAYDMLVAGYYGPRYAELAEFNKTASADEKINIDEWTESDKKTAEEAYRRYGTELKRLQDMRNVQRKDLLDFMVDAGLYTREKADRFLKRAEYVALYRVPEEEIESFDRPTTKGAGLLGAGKEYRLVGSKRAAADPIDNYIANMSWMMQRGIKNNAAKHTADMMQQLGVGQWYDRPMTDVEKKAYHHITVHVDGLPKDFRVDDPNDMAAFSASPIISGAVWDLMKYPVSGLRHGITMMPQFVWNQAWEDPIRATFTSGNKAGFMNNIIKTWKSIANNQFRSDRTPNAAMLNRYGIVGQKDVLDSADIINLYKGKDKKIWQKSLFFFERMAQGSDLGAREAIYENAIKELQAEGYDRETAEDMAAVRSHQYMPYQQMGMSRSLAYLRRMMPFVNPPIQGMARDIAAARGRISGISKAEGKKLLAFRLSKYLMFTAMYAAFMSGDDDYENQSEEQQDNNFFIGGLRMPVPQELRPLKVAAERGTRAWVLNAPKADIEDMDVAAAALRKTWELVAGFAPVPSAVRPLVENYTNFDIFSGLPVVSAGQQRKEPYLQYTEKTSELAKVVGAQLNYSPIKIDKLLKGYFGYLGQTLGQITNYFAGDRPAPTANDILFIGSMLENQRATGNRGDFYELYDKVVGAKASANALKQEGDIEAYRKYVQENRGYLGVAPRVNQLHTMLTRLRQQKEFILKSNRSPEEKRIAIDNIMAKENRMLDNIRQLHKRAIENNN